MPAPTLKKQLLELLRARDLEQLARLARRRQRVLGLLTSLTFDPDPLIAWRAIEATGAAAQAVAHDDPDAVRDHLRRLHWLLSEESGGVGWRAPESMAEIICRRPDLFADYLPIVVSLLGELAEEDLAHFRPGVLWAIGRLGPLAEPHLADVEPAILSALDDADPQVRGLAAWCLGQVGRGALLADRDDLLADDAPVRFYEAGRLVRTTVAALARRARDVHAADGRD